MNHHLKTCHLKTLISPWGLIINSFLIQKSQMKRKFRNNGDFFQEMDAQTSEPNIGARTSRKK
jgi:hypothetical protein